MSLGTSAWACDGCGCSISQAYFGLTPNAGNYAGLWWQHQRYRLAPDPLFSDIDRGGADYFNSVAMRGRWAVSSRLQVTSIIPMVINQRQFGGMTALDAGFGDIVVLANWTAFDNSDSLGQAVRHRLSVGAGIKAPTGDFRDLEGTNDVNPYYQTGTGSWDFLFNLAYTLRWQDMGLHLEGTPRLNTANREEYRFGHRMDISSTYYYLISMPQMTLMPTLGLHAEYMGLDVERGYYRTNTGGRNLLTNFGLETYWKDLNLGVSWSLPIAQHWNNERITTQQRLSVHVNYFL